MTRILDACRLRRRDKGQRAQGRSRADYQNALDAYQACINSNLNNMEACEDKRVQMETSERAYQAR